MLNENMFVLVDNCFFKVNFGDMYFLFLKKKFNEVEVVLYICIYGFDIMGIFSRIRNEESIYIEIML